MSRSILADADAAAPCTSASSRLAIRSSGTAPPATVTHACTSACSPGSWATRAGRSAPGVRVPVPGGRGHAAVGWPADTWAGPRRSSTRGEAPARPRARRACARALAPARLRRVRAPRGGALRGAADRRGVSPSRRPPVTLVEWAGKDPSSQYLREQQADAFSALLNRYTSRG